MAGFDGFRTMYESSQASIILAINFEAEQKTTQCEGAVQKPIRKWVVSTYTIAYR